MGDGDDTFSAIVRRSLQKMNDTACCGFVQIACRLVGEEHAGRTGKRSRNGDALLLPTAEREHIFVRDLCWQPNLCEEGRRVTSATEAHIFLCSEVIDEVVALKNERDVFPPPGTSEHELGLAVDIGTETLALYDWLAAESWRYGFIQRYPPDKTALTGVSHEPWHYRYVGESAASEMHAQGLCLEEYVQTLAE